MTEETRRILSTEYSEQFDELRKKQMVMSHYKYGYIKENSNKHAIDYIKTLELRIAKYKETGNIEFLGDIANFAMIEFMHPQHPKAHYKPTDSHESPGVYGMSIKEIQDFKLND